VDYWWTKIENAIGGGCNDLNDPFCRQYLLVQGDPNFDAVVAAAMAHPASVIPVTTPASAIRFVEDGGTINIGSVTGSGVDFRLQYDHDLGNWGTFRIGTSGTYYIFRRTDDGLGNVDDPYVGNSTTSGLGNSTSPRWRARHQIGWTNGTFSATLFANYRAHRHGGFNIPPASVRPANWTQYRPETYYFDLSLAYNTGDAPTNPYLQNINIQLVMNNVFDRPPPFGYTSGGASGLYAFDPQYNPEMRDIILTVTKTW
jgi:hypothetical protein